MRPGHLELARLRQGQDICHELENFLLLACGLGAPATVPARQQRESA